MKWIEVTSEDKTELYNMSDVTSIRLIGKVIVFYQTEMVTTIKSKNKAIAQIKYDNIKDYCLHFGPGPGELTLNSDGSLDLDEIW